MMRALKRNSKRRPKLTAYLPTESSAVVTIVSVTRELPLAADQAGARRDSGASKIFSATSSGLAMYLGERARARVVQRHSEAQTCVTIWRLPLKKPTAA